MQLVVEQQGLPLCLLLCRARRCKQRRVLTVEAFGWRRQQGPTIGQLARLNGLEVVDLPDSYWTARNGRHGVQDAATLGMPGEAAAAASALSVAAPLRLVHEGVEGAASTIQQLFGRQGDEGREVPSGQARWQEIASTAEAHTAVLRSQGLMVVQDNQYVTFTVSKAATLRCAFALAVVGALLALREQLRRKRAAARAAVRLEAAQNSKSLASQRSRLRTALDYAVDADVVEQAVAEAKAVAAQRMAEAEAQEMLEAAAATAAEVAGGTVKIKVGGPRAGAGPVGAPARAVQPSGRGGVAVEEGPPPGYWDNDDDLARLREDDRVNPRGLDEATRRKWADFVKGSKMLNGASWWDFDYERANAPLPDTIFDWQRKKK